MNRALQEHRWLSPPVARSRAAIGDLLAPP
jgi:hypothetical protein